MKPSKDCPQLFPGCEGCPFISKTERKLTNCPFYLGIHDYSLEQHDMHERAGQLLKELSKKEAGEENYLKESLENWNERHAKAV